MVQRALRQVGPEERVVHRARWRRWPTAAGSPPVMPLPRHEQVGPDAALLDGEQRAGAPEAGGHLVADEEHVVAAARVGQTGHELGRATGPCRPRPARAARRRRRRGGRPPRRGSPRWRRGRRRAPARPGSAAGRTRRCRSRRRRPTASRSCRRGRRRRRRGSGRGPSTPWFVQCWNAILSACSTAAAPSLANRTWGSSTGHPLGQRLGQLDHDPVAVAEHRRVGDLVELVADRLVELGHPVAERGDPQRRDGVEVAAALDVDQLAALGRADDDRRVVGVGRHLREPVPDHARRRAPPRRCGRRPSRRS